MVLAVEIRVTHDITERLPHLYTNAAPRTVAKNLQSLMQQSARYSVRGCLSVVPTSSCGMYHNESGREFRG